MKAWHALAVGLFFLGCATDNQKSNSNLLIGQDQNVQSLSPNPSDLNDNETDMQKLPAELNEKVTEWVEYFKGRGRPHMKLYLSRSSRYLPEMKKVLKSHGLPEDLVYIALIESGFNPKAYSRSRAVGYWQFMQRTGKAYGLEQNYYIDERRDFVRSTEAASMYLKALYNLFGSWYLAIASYNVGENRIKRLVMTYYTRDFWELAKQNRLPKETTNYVPKFLAARLIAKHPEKYGFTDVEFEKPLDYKELSVQNKGVDFKLLAKNLNVSSDEVLALNPSYLRGVLPQMKGVTKIRVPAGFDGEALQVALQKSSSTITFDSIASSEGKIYRIRRGDTLSHIAAQHNTTIRSILEANNFSARQTLYPGKKIIIPGSGKSAVRRQTAEQPQDLKPGEKTYVVQEGDNLYTIARRFGVSLAKIKDRNQLHSRTLLNIGKILVIPGGS